MDGLATQVGAPVKMPKHCLPVCKVACLVDQGLRPVPTSRPARFMGPAEAGLGVLQRGTMRLCDTSCGLRRTLIREGRRQA